MKNFDKIYKGIKAIEEGTLFKFNGQNDMGEFIFVCDSVVFNYFIHIDEEDLYIVNNDNTYNVLLSRKELKLFSSFMEILKEFN